MKILQNSGVPIYQQISEQLKSDILAGKYKEGEYLPSIRGLAQDLKISVITTMKAYELLQSEGLVTAMQGKGYYVNELDGYTGFVFSNKLDGLHNPHCVNLAIKRIYEAYNAKEIIDAKREHLLAQHLTYDRCQVIR